MVSGGIEMSNWRSKPSQVSALTSGNSQMKAYLRIPGTAMMVVGVHTVYSIWGLYPDTPNVKIGREQERGMSNDNGCTRK